MEIKNTNSDLKSILIIDDEENMRHMLSSMLEKSGYIARTASDGYEGLKMIRQTGYDFILCDVRMPNMDGMEFLKSAKSDLGSTTVIMMSAYGTIDTAIDAIKLGAYDYISKPFKRDEVLLVLKKAEERELLKKENLFLRERIRNIKKDYNFGNMVARSKKMRLVFQLARKAAEYNTTVLITGDSGTGKELIAKGIHFAGPRSDMPIVPVNCGGIPETLLESELFGYKKGAFTGADRNKRGLFEEADGGTIFLDEIGEMPLSLQVKLLRVLQESEIRRLGDSKTKKINVRVIAATSKKLEEEIKTGQFREDLYFRLNVLPVHLPPLMDRPEDIPVLCRHFIDKFNKIMEKTIKGITPAAMTVLLKHNWPGNVRELENFLERAVILSETNYLTPESFPLEQGTCSDMDTTSMDMPFEGYSLKAAKQTFEKNLIMKALIATGGNRSHAIKLLEISHPALLSKMKQYNISIPPGKK